MPILRLKRCTKHKNFDSRVPLALQHNIAYKHNTQIPLQMADLGKLTFDLSSILGSSTQQPSQMAHTQDCLIYVAGAYLVFYSPLIDEQVTHLQHPNANINAVMVSPNQQLLAVAEKGKHPVITVYDISDLERLSSEPVYELRGHKMTIDHITFSPNSRYLLSVSNYDGSMFLWEGKECLTKNRMSKSLTRVVFDPRGDLITIGRGYFKLWPFKNGEVVRRKEEDCWMMEGKMLTFGKKFTTKELVDITFYQAGGQANPEKDRVLLLTHDGMLCLLFSQYEKIDKWIDLMMEKTTSMTLLSSMALCAGQNASVKVIDVEKLTLRSRFPKPPPNDKENITKDESFELTENDVFPVCVGIMRVGQFVATLYANRTAFVWKIEEEIAAIRAIITHRGRIHSLCLLEEIKGDINFFSTVSQDNTLRIWHFWKRSLASFHESVDIADVIGIKRNVYCRNLTRIIYTDSEHPITQMRMLGKSSIACISRLEFLLYSLENFELVLQETLEEDSPMHGSAMQRQLTSLEVLGEYVFIGGDSGVRVYRVGDDQLEKLKEIQCEMPVESMQLAGNKVLAYGKGRLKVLSAEGNTVSNHYNVECATASGNYLVLCEKKTVTMMNMVKNRKTASMTLTHELDENENLRLARSNSWLILLLTTKQRIILSNFSSTVLYSELMTEPIADVAVTEQGSIIIATESGTVIVKQQQANTKYQKIDDKVKQLVEANDLSWMEGSIWTSKNKSYREMSKKSIEMSRSDSIKLSGDLEIDKSVGIGQVELPSLAISYKNEDNRRSIFNPQEILNVANKAYKNVDQLMKNKRQEKEPSPKSKLSPEGSGLYSKTDQPNSLIAKKSEVSDDSIEEINLQPSFANMESQQSVPKQRRTMMAQGESSNNHSRPTHDNSLTIGYQPKFSNNLVESVVHSIKKDSSQSPAYVDDKVNEAPPEESIHLGLSQSPESIKGEQQSARLTYSQSNQFHAQSASFMHSIKTLMENADNPNASRENVETLITEHYDAYKNLHRLLDGVFGRESREDLKKSVAAEYQKLSQQFMAHVGDL